MGAGRKLKAVLRTTLGDDVSVDGTLSYAHAHNLLPRIWMSISAPALRIGFVAMPSRSDAQASTSRGAVRNADEPLGCETAAVETVAHARACRLQFSGAGFVGDRATMKPRLDAASTSERAWCCGSNGHPWGLCSVLPPGQLSRELNKTRGSADSQGLQFARRCSAPSRRPGGRCRGSTCASRPGRPSGQP